MCRLADQLAATLPISPAVDPAKFKKDALDAAETSMLKHATHSLVKVENPDFPFDQLNRQWVDDGVKGAPRLLAPVEIQTLINAQSSSIVTAERVLVATGCLSFWATTMSTHWRRYWVVRCASLSYLHLSPAYEVHPVRMGHARCVLRVSPTAS